MKIVALGDSITDMGRSREEGINVHSYGSAYSFFIEGEFAAKSPKKHVLYNRGISGNRIVDVYARVKADCWNLQPDLISILIGVNDVWHEIAFKNGVEIDRYEREYEKLLDDTLAVLPNVKILLLEPFVLKGSATSDRYDEFLAVKEYAKRVKALAERKNCVFVPLQARFDELAAEYGDEHWLFDGVHPTVAGSKIIAEEWLKAFYAHCDD